MTIGERIRERRRAAGLSQVDLAVEINVSKQTLYKYEKNIVTNIPSTKIEAIAEACYTTPAYLMGWDDDPHDWDRLGNEQGIYPPNDWEGDPVDYIKAKLSEGESPDLIDPPLHTTHESESIRVPVLGRVAAGIPIEAVEDIIDYEEIPKEMAKGNDYFALKIKGDSMEPRIWNGDVVIVRKQDDAESDEIIIATVNGDDATCKRLMKYKDAIGLLSLNSKYPPMMFSKDEISKKPVRILGKVVEVRGKLEYI